MLTISTDDRGIVIEPRAVGWLVYLDNDAVIELSKGDQARKASFVESIRSPYSELLFSFANFIEAGGPEGDSADAVRAFLESIGPNWVPLEMNPWTVAERERAASHETTPCISTDLIRNYVKKRTHETEEPGKLISLDSESFWRLDVVLDWEREDHDRTIDDSNKLDAAFLEAVEQLRLETADDPSSLDRKYPAAPLKRDQPATYVLTNIMRALATNKGDTLKSHDGFDLCHAVMGVAYGTIATLDKQWKKRVTEAMPSMSGLARLYYRPEVDRLVADLARLVASATRN